MKILKKKITEGALKAKKKAQQIKVEILDRVLLDSSKQKIEDLKQHLVKLKKVKDADAEVFEKLGKGILVRINRIRQGLRGGEDRPVSAVTKRSQKKVRPAAKAPREKTEKKSKKASNSLSKRQQKTKKPTAGRKSQILH